MMKKGVFTLAFESWLPIEPNSVTFYEAKTEVKFNTYSNISRSEKIIQYRIKPPKQKQTYKREKDTQRNSFGFWFLFGKKSFVWWIVEDGEQDRGDPVEQSGNPSGQWRRRGLGVPLFGQEAQGPSLWQGFEAWIINP